MNHLVLRLSLAAVCASMMMVACDDGERAGGEDGSANDRGGPQDGSPVDLGQLDQGPADATTGLPACDRHFIEFSPDGLLWCPAEHLLYDFSQPGRWSDRPGGRYWSRIMMAGCTDAERPETPQSVSVLVGLLPAAREQTEPGSLPVAALDVFFNLTSLNPFEHPARPLAAEPWLLTLREFSDQTSQGTLDHLAVTLEPDGCVQVEASGALWNNGHNPAIEPPPDLQPLPFTVRAVMPMVGGPVE